MLDFELKASDPSKFAVLPAKEESAAEYTHLGYCPIRPGITILNNDHLRRDYLVVRKLGRGQYATTWLCQDTASQQYVAIKISRAHRDYLDTALEEFHIIRIMQQGNVSTKHDGKKHILQVIDYFYHKSPHGTHICIITEIGGENLRVLLDRTGPLPLLIVRELAVQLLQSLDYLHTKADLIHTDLKPANIIFTHPDIQSMVKEQLDEDMGSATAQVGVGEESDFATVFPSQPIFTNFKATACLPTELETDDDVNESSSPCSSMTASYISTSPVSLASSHTSLASMLETPKLADRSFTWSPREALTYRVAKPPHLASTTLPVKSYPSLAKHETIEWHGPPPAIKIIDFGAATSTHCRARYYVGTQEYRAPEVFVGREWDTKVDIFALGCILFEAATGHMLFAPTEGRSKGTRNFSEVDDMLALLQEALGRFDRESLAGGRFVRNLFNSAGKLRRIKTLAFWPLLDILVDRHGFSRADVLPFVAFLERMLTLSPSDRSSAKELLSDPFITGRFPPLFTVRSIHRTPLEEKRKLSKDSIIKVADKTSPSIGQVELCSQPAEFTTSMQQRVSTLDDDIPTTALLPRASSLWSTYTANIRRIID